MRFSRQEIVALDRIARKVGANPVDLVHQVLREWIAKEDSRTLETRQRQPTHAPRAATG
jgi:hypothetical protein